MPVHELRPDHQLVPAKDTAVSVSGPNEGQAADLTNPRHYPVEAVCRCGKPIRAGDYYADWQHVEVQP